MAAALGEDSVAARAAHGSPAPQLVGPEGFGSINWAYMDDYGALASSASAGIGVREVVHEMTPKVKSYLAAVGLPVHKEAESEGLESLGAIIEGRPYRVAADPRKTCMLALVTLQLVERQLCTVAILERIVGLWAWPPSSSGAVSRSSTRSTSR